MSNSEEIIAELEAERDRISRAIEALSQTGAKAGRTGNRRDRRLSNAARRRISLGMKRRWAERKKTEKAG